MADKRGDTRQSRETLLPMGEALIYLALLLFLIWGIVGFVAAT